MAAEPSTPITVVDNPAASRYEAWAGTRRAGLLVYRPRPGGVVLVHTEVDPAFEGHGVAGHLAAFALDAARAAGSSVVPRCAYVAHYIERHPEYADLVADGA